MKVSTKIIVFVVTLATLVVLFSFEKITPKGVRTDQSPTSGLSSATQKADQILSTDSIEAPLSKTQILSIVKDGAPISAEIRGRLFYSLSGTNILRYEFTQAEKVLIVRALNALSGGSQPAKASSSARSGLTRFSESAVSAVAESGFSLPSATDLNIISK